MSDHKPLVNAAIRGGEYGNGYQIIGKDECQCGEVAECDECATQSQIIAALTNLASRVDAEQPQSEAKAHGANSQQGDER